MKKSLAIILSIVMLLGVMPLTGLAAEVTLDPAASAYAEYDKNKVASNDAAYIDALSYDQMASIILDWVDRQIAEATADFQSFNVKISEGVEVPVEIDVDSLDDIIAYSGYLTQLGGDFANLDVSKLSSLSRANGDVNFIYGVLQFMADNAAIFGKVFHWEEGKVFDYGKVGEYIANLDTNDAENKKIVDFYNNYLIGNDIQEKFIAGVAKEMNYNIPVDENGARAETFDQIISNGIIAWFSGICEKNGILSAEGLEALRAYDLRTEDIYAHVKNFVALVQSDNQVKIDTYFRFVCDNYIRTALKVMFGFAPTTGEAVANDALVAEFKAAYADTAYLAEISAGSVYYQAADKSYYLVTLAADGAITAVQPVTWENTMGINFEPPVVGVYTGADAEADKVIDGYNCDLVREYRPSKDYSFGIYTTFADALAGTDIPVLGTAVPEEYNSVMTEANAIAMRDLVGVNVTGVDPEFNTVITFDQIKALAEEKALEAANQLAANMNATVNSVNVTLNYNGYATDDEFITSVTATAKANVTAFGFTSDIDVPANMLPSPVATIVLDNLSGGLNVDDAFELMNSIDSDFVVDTAILDFASNYDAYNGAIGQMNRILCNAVEMLTTDEAYANLALTEGGNQNLTANIQKICDKFAPVFEQAKSFMNEEGFAEFVAASGVNDLFASSHGFNASMVYNLDFSDVESLYVCLIEMVLDFIDKEEPGTLVNDLHVAVEGLETLDAMAVALTDYALAKCVPEANAKFAAYGLNLTVPAKTDATTVADGGAKDIIMTKLVDLAYEGATWAVDTLLNDVLNDVIANVNTEAGADLPKVKFALGVEKAENWEATLTALTNRAYELANGIIIVCGTYEGTNVFDKISAVVNAILPMGSMFSNCAGNGFACDLNKVLNSYIFGDVLEGNFDNFLRLFETAEKTDDVAKGVPVTYALIKASDHIVDAIFPDTVKAENYTASLTVQEEFTSGDSDVVIAANNMKSINGRKTHLVPAALELVREAGILPYFAACKHEATKTVTGTPATCTEDGKQDAVVCASCGYLISGGEVIPATGHHYGEWATTKEATCTEDGLKARTCPDCGESETEVIAATGHHYGEWVTTKEATCTEDGLKARTCACGETETEVIAATGHHYGEWAVTTPATCTAKGVETRACACGETETRDIPMIAHTFGAWTVTTPATCTAKGVETRTCACGATETRDIPMIAHTFGAWTVTKAATCTAKGVETRTCACGATETRDIPMIAHAYGEWTVTKAATCTEDGVETRTCVCGKTETKTIAATGHTDTNDDGKCDNCGEQLKQEDTSFLGRLKAFFQRIIDWFRNLFK